MDSMDMSPVSGPDNDSAVRFPSPQQSEPPAGHDQQAAPIKRRAPIACRRCRRMRSKCLHERNPPCKSCLEAGVPEECVFPTRGESDQDRQFRHPRQRTDRRPKAEGPRVKRESIASPSLLYGSLVTTKAPKWEDDDWSMLPEVSIVKESVVDFTLHYFQLGFIPKERFPMQIEQDPKSVSVFLLLSILSISARFNKRFEAQDSSRGSAVDFFTRCAEKLAMRELYQKPTLERCQAFYLLSIAQHGMGMTNSSYINMGIATRMASLMRLHREETYERITQSSTSEEIIRAESARRTMWMLHSQDNLHSGPYKPVSLASSDVTALLPCDEEDFKLARIPPSRAALVGTKPAERNPALTSLKDRSLFATLIQTHHLWGLVARRAVANEKSPHPDNSNSDYAKIARQLAEFEAAQPEFHKFGKKLLKGYRQDHEDLAYTNVCSTLRLSNIVLRKAYLEEMVYTLRNKPTDPSAPTYRKMADELFSNVWSLFEQIDAHFDDERPLEELVGSQMASFCVYSCGLLASYLVKFPYLWPYQRPGNGPSPETMYDRTVAILEQAMTIWPLASSWLKGLKKWRGDTSTAKVYEGGSMTDGRDPQPYALLHPPVSTSSWTNKLPGILSPRPAPFSLQSQKAATARPEPEPEPAQLPPLQPPQPSFTRPAPPPSLPPPPLPQYASPQQPPRQPLPHHAHHPPPMPSPVTPVPSSMAPAPGHSHHQHAHHPPPTHQHAPPDLPSFAMPPTTPGHPHHQQHQHQQHQHQQHQHQQHQHQQHQHQHQQQQPYGGFYALHQAGQHVGGSPADPYSPAFLPDFATAPMPIAMNDGFNYHLQQWMDPNWSAPDAAAPLYPYNLTDVPSHTP